ncbi:hypothetical protein [Tabrizicola soli]|uniref:Uncharacterized protein n=1 Tax=Tabrizicola soli TaxID=2185115 RepID=A0ABV7DZC7_9RHOB|nr:hypothetical protein [Tabrizicola soli]
MSAVPFLYFVMVHFSLETIFSSRKSPEQAALCGLVVVLAAAIALLAEGGAA